MTKTDWETIKLTYHVGQRVDCTTHKVWKWGIIVELDDGLIGVIRSRELSWEQTVDDATTFLHEGKPLVQGRRLAAVVLRLDHRKRQAVLSIRWAIYDPWEQENNKYVIGQVVAGKVTYLNRIQAHIEFDDHITAKLPSTEIVPWHIGSIEEIIGKGDCVEIKVKGKNQQERELLASMKDRLEEIGKELSPFKDTESIWEPEFQPEVKKSDSLESVGIGLQIERILVCDDKEDELIFLEDSLNELGYENVDTVNDFDEAVQQAITGEYDLILLDVKKDGNSLAGIEAATSIRAKKSEIPIVLVTADTSDEISRKGQALNLAGIVRKPIISEDLASALDSLKRIGHAGWPVSLVENDIRVVEFVRDISKAATIHRPLTEALKGILDQVVLATEAEKAAIFSMDPRTGSVEMLTSIGISQKNFLNSRYNLVKSPVNDVIYRSEHIRQNHVPAYEGKFRYLLRLVSFKSCIGVPISGAAGDLGYGLFILHYNEGHFSDGDLLQAEATAMIIGRTIRDHWMIAQVAADQRLTMLGTTLTSIGHELKGRLNAMAAVESLVRNWNSISQEPNRLSDPNLVRKIEQDLKGLVTARQGMANLIDLLLGSSTQSRGKVADVAHCLQSAVNVVAHKASKASVELITKPNWVPQVNGGNLELETVFMNVLLNAIEQAPLAHRLNSRVVIETEYNPADQQFPVKVRITDTGPGIHAKHLEKIFEPLFTTKDKGTGMGLYICRELLASIGGKIQVEKTAILIGTAFLIELSKP